MGLRGITSRSLLDKAAVFLMALAVPAGLSMSQAAPACTSAECHGPLLDRSSVHAAAADGECEICHDPVAGEDHAFQSAPDPVSELCLGCHDDPTEEGTTRHAPAAIGVCTVCHDPHASDLDSLLKAPVNELCLSCHAVGANREGFDPPRVPLFETVRGHPNIKHPVAGVPDPTREGKSLTCASCHDPHASKHESLLIGGSGYGNCKRCHTR